MKKISKREAATFLAQSTANYLLGVHGRIAIRLAARASNSVTGRSVQDIFIYSFLFYFFFRFSFMFLMTAL
jgi:hypothetical protein